MDMLLSPFSRSVLLQSADSTAQIGMHDASLDTALDGPLPLHWSARCHSPGLPLFLAFFAFPPIPSIHP